MHEDTLSAESGAALVARLRPRLLRATVGANVAGALVVALLLGFFFFEDEELRELVHLDPGIALFAAYVAAAAVLAWRWVDRRSRPLWAWLASDREPEPWQRDLALRQPVRSALPPAAVWAGAAATLGVIEAVEHSLHRGLDVGLTIVLGGVTTCAITYLLADVRLRPAVARALSSSPPDARSTAGVSTRLVVVWVLATGVPLLGLVLIGVVSIVADEYERDELGAAAAALGFLAIAAGLLSTWLAAASLGHSLAGLRAGLAEIRAGNFRSRVTVDDSTEVGLLQAGFNEMASGLEERERVRDLFGRHVGEDVAREALGRETGLGGEVRQVAALFVDIEGSTELAASRPPEEVVELLNRFFAVVVDVVDRCGGWVNKFEGDAALCVFGAPREDREFAGRALSAAEAMRTRLAEEVPELSAGIGVSAGDVVAGNVGAEARYEYTVIGDPVNEAARLCDLAKSHGGVLAAERVLRLADDQRAARWRLLGSEVLRGRAEPTAFAAPV